MPAIADLCERFRTTKDKRGAVLVVDRPDAIKLLVAFTLAPMPAWSAPRRKMPSEDRELWLWMWTGYEGGPRAPDFLDTLALVAGINAESARRVWPSLMISRLVFPDGTLSSEASRLIDARVENAIAPRRGPGRPPNPPAIKMPDEPKPETEEK